MLPSSALRCQYSLTGRAALLLRPDAICNLEAEDFSSQYRHLGRPPCSEPLLGGSLGASKARYSSVSTDTDPKGQSLLCVCVCWERGSAGGGGGGGGGAYRSNSSPLTLSHSPAVLPLLAFPS